MPVDVVTEIEIGEPPGFSKIAAPALVGAMRRANRKDLEWLKAILEAR